MSEQILLEPSPNEIATTASRPRLDLGEFWLGYNKQLGITAALLVLCLGLALAKPSFVSQSNIVNLMRQSALLVLVAQGQMLVLLTGGIDLSVGSIAGLAGIVSGFVMVKWGYGTGMGLISGVLIGLACGLTNGLLIAKLRLNPFVITLGTSAAFRGLIVVTTHGFPTIGLPDSFVYLGTGDILSIPITFIIAVVSVALCHLMLTRSRLGRMIHGVGSDESAMAWWGVKTDRVRLAVFCLSGMLSAAAGVLLVARLTWSKPEAGAAWLLPSIAASVIGGTSLSGGEGKAIGVLIGAVFLTVIDNGLVLMGASQFLRDILVGAVIILAIGSDLLYRRFQRS